mmetsp:Transcript_2957/g.5112  ORF Transcript_2957/g.5112 Transcript_2957/m.5112 type:complete len:329 (+) Transcript_2957:109-1095(+)
MAGHLDLRRKAQIARARPSDHAADVVVRPSKTFDLDKTIFRTLDSTLARLATKDRMGIEVLWTEAAARQIESAFASLPPAPVHDQALLDFMTNDCDFKMEHADGSFLDHLQFCYEYSTAHFKGHSARVLFLHSIMGVGTNYFPMKLDLVPKLQSLLSKEEFLHIEAFPSILRLLLHFDFVKELESQGPARLMETFDGVYFHRVMDNKKLFLDGESFWVQMNYQLIHLMDFLPIADWRNRMDDTYLDVFLALHALLANCAKLQANVDLQLPSVETVGGSTQTTLIGFLMTRFVPSAVKRKLRQKEIMKFSGQIGHSLNYHIQWKDSSRL